ncbi:hypothetical protein JCM10212_002825 [Sporobolomyces blumeae]
MAPSPASTTSPRTDRRTSTSSGSSDGSGSDTGTQSSLSADTDRSATGSDRDDDSSGEERDGDEDEAFVERRKGKRRRRRRREDPLVLHRQGSHPSTTVVVLALLVLLAIATAAYFYIDGGDLSLADALGLSGETATASQRDADETEGNAKSSAETSTKGASSRTKETGTTMSTKTSTTGSSATDSSTSDPKPTKSGDSGASSPSTATPTGTSSSSSSGGSLKCKKGIGYNDAKLTLQLDLCWAYNWANAPGGTLSSGVMFVPMLWGEKMLEGWATAADAAINDGATHILGFNEPDLNTQADMSPLEAASLWSSAIEPLATRDVKLISPAVTNGVATPEGAPMGVPWLKQFIKACDKCTIDAVALHWYDSAGNIEYFQTYLEDAHTALSKPIWLTEYMGTGTDDERVSMIVTTVDWLEKQDWIEAYAAFGDFCDNDVANFVDCDGNLNTLGQAYSNAK